MLTVLLIKNWQEPDLFRQTPKGTGVWKGIRFISDPQQPCDYCVVLNYAPQKLTITCPDTTVWLLLQEPPNEYFRLRHQGAAVYQRVFTTDSSLSAQRYVHDQPAIPWQVDKDYDALVSMKMPKKRARLSWITSLKTAFAGHRARMQFLSSLRRSQVAVDVLATQRYAALPQDQLLARGYTAVVPGKWEGLAPYHYSLAIENFSGPDYWSEKLADCFLAGTLPIYYGCTNLSRYFPKESYVPIDITDPDAPRQIRDLTSRLPTKKQTEAIAQARNLVLNTYQLFPYLSGYITAWERAKKNSPARDIVLPGEDTFCWRARLAAETARFRLRGLL